MFSPMLSIYLIPFFVAMFLAINMGGSGTAASFSAAYGANLLRKDLIPGLFGIFVFLGAIFAGKKVVLTMSGGILPSSTITFTLTIIILLSVSISLFIANLLRVPQSTSQAAVFALVGPAIYFNLLQTKKLLFEIVPSWFLLPILAFFITLLIGKFIYKPIKQRELFNFEKLSVHPTLKIIVIGASFYGAFAVGANNVANAAGPIAAMIMNELQIAPGGDDFVLIMIVTTLIIAPCFAIGSSIFGRRVIETPGREIIGFGPLGATYISLITATLLLLASITRGIPTCGVQINVMAIMGLGVAKVGWKEISKRTSVRKLITVWFISPLIALGLSYFLTLAADKLDIL